MSSASTASAPSPQQPAPLGAFLSYLVPGLGQISQGRYGKGFLFMVCLLGMFHLGQAMGNWQNVYIHSDPQGRGRGVSSLVTRWHYAGQFWIGIAAWPALMQHFNVGAGFLSDFQKMPNEEALNQFLVNSDKSPDLGWVYTVVAGMLNLLVMYDAYAGPIRLPTPKPASPGTEPKVGAA